MYRSWPPTTYVSGARRKMEKRPKPIGEQVPACTTYRGSTPLNPLAIQWPAVNVKAHLPMANWPITVHWQITDHCIPPPNDSRQGPPTYEDLPLVIPPLELEDLPRRVEPCVHAVVVHIEIRVGPWWRWRRWHTATAVTAATI